MKSSPACLIIKAGHNQVLCQRAGNRDDSATRFLTTRPGGPGPRPTEEFRVQSPQSGGQNSGCGTIPKAASQNRTRQTALEGRAQATWGWIRGATQPDSKSTNFISLGIENEKGSQLQIFSKRGCAQPDPKSINFISSAIENEKGSQLQKSFEKGGGPVAPEKYNFY